MFHRLLNEFLYSWQPEPRLKEVVQHGDLRAEGSRTFEKPELHAASHAHLYESGHIVVLVDDTHFDSEALTVLWCSEGHLYYTNTHIQVSLNNTLMQPSGKNPMTERVINSSYIIKYKHVNLIWRTSN